MSASFTDNFIADTYTGILHSDAELPSMGTVNIYDGVGNISAIKLGRSGQGIDINGGLTATSANIPEIISTTVGATTIIGTTIYGTNIDNTKLISSSITSDILNVAGTITGGIVNCNASNSTNLSALNAVVNNLTVTSGFVNIANVENLNLNSTNIKSTDIKTTDITSTDIVATNNVTSKTIDTTDMSASGTGSFNNLNITSGVLNVANLNSTNINNSERIRTKNITATQNITSDIIDCRDIRSSETGSFNNLIIISGILNVANLNSTNINNSERIVTQNITSDIMDCRGIRSSETGSFNNLSAINLSAINLSAIKLNAINLSAINLNAINLNAGRIIGTSLNAGNIEYPISPTSKNLFDLIYPVGAIYLSVTTTNPGTIFLGTTWVNTSEGKFLVGVGTGSDTNGVPRGFNVEFNSGGEYQHTLTVPQMPSHNHDGIIEIPAHMGLAARNLTYLRSVIGVNSIPDHESAGGAHEATGISPTGVPTRSGSGSKVGGQVNLTNSGNGAAHNVTPPSFGVYVWQRTA
jgi:hypothetical protein